MQVSIAGFITLIALIQLCVTRPNSASYGLCCIRSRQISYRSLARVVPYNLLLSVSAIHVRVHCSTVAQCFDCRASCCHIFDVHPSSSLFAASADKLMKY